MKTFFKDGSISSLDQSVGFRPKIILLGIVLKACYLSEGDVVIYVKFRFILKRPEFDSPSL
jgi:hypothetical protein